MSDLISRRAVLKHIEKIRYAAQMMDDTHRASILMNGMHLCEEAVRNQTSAQKTGRWIDRGYMKVGYHCSECGGYSIDGKDNYCPKCGAKMEAEHE